MPLNKNRPKENDELYRSGEQEPYGSVKIFAGQALTPGNWLVYDTLGMPREITHNGSRWVLVDDNRA